MRRGQIIVALGLAAALGGAAPVPALAYFNRGAVKVEAAAAQLDVRAGEREGLTLQLTPASDKQAEGCGMPSCPQGCSDSCMDENGQCQCAGREYQTYMPQVRATSSDPSVAVAVADGGSLTVYGKKAGTATITVRASLRQFTDGRATVKVRVTGKASDAKGSPNAYTEIPAAAEASADAGDVLDQTEKTVMGRTIRYVKMNDAADPVARLRDFAGTNGDLTFWSGDTYYQPAWSVTFKGTEIRADAVDGSDPVAEVSREAAGELTQPLAGLDAFEVVRLAQAGDFCAPAKVYVQSEGLFKEGDAIAAFRYDASTGKFSKVKDADAKMMGTYAAFTASTGGDYVISTRDLEVDAKSAVAASGSIEPDACMGDMGSGDATKAAAHGGHDADAGASEAHDAGAPWAIPAAVAVIAAAGVAAWAVVRKRSAAGAADGAAADAGIGSMADANASSDADAGTDAGAGAGADEQAPARDGDAR